MTVRIVTAFLNNIKMITYNYRQQAFTDVSVLSVVDWFSV